jgi:hypothetical protein
MAFGNVTSFALNGPSNASLLGWGTNVRRLNLASDGAANQTTTTNHGTGGAVSRTVNLFGASTSTGAQANFGFAVATDDMGGSTGARRFYRAGVHTLFLGASSSAVATSADARLVMTAYRVGLAGGYARTELGSVQGTPFNLGAVPSRFQTVSVALTLPEIILEPGETLQYSLDVLSPGNAIVGRIITLRVGTSADRMTFPQLSVLADTDGAATGLASGLGVMGKVLGTLGTTAGVGEALGVMGATSTTTGLAQGTAVAVGRLSAIATTTGAAAGDSLTLGEGGLVLGTVGTVDYLDGVGPGVPEGSYVVDAVHQEYIHQIAMLHGLEAGSPLVVSHDSRRAGGLIQTVSGTDTVTITTIGWPALSGNADTWLDGLAAIHGLTSPMTVTKTTRMAGAVEQTISTVGPETTVELKWS